MKKYRNQYQIRIKPSVPKSELAAAIAEHFASIPVPEETEVIDQFFKALQKNRTGQSETEESSDEPVNTKNSDLKKRFKVHQEKEKNQIASSSDSKSLEISKNSSQSNSKKTAKRNSIPKVESKFPCLYIFNWNCI